MFFDAQILFGHKLYPLVEQCDHVFVRELTLRISAEIEIVARIVYGVFFGWGTFFLYVILVAWLMKSAWSKLSLTWKYHLGLAALINIPLYLLFCAPGELRNLSMLFISFMVSLAVYLNEVIISVQRRQ